MALGRAGDESGLWPVLSGEVVAIVLLGGATLVRPPPWTADLRWVGIILAAGLLSVSANVLFFASDAATLRADDERDMATWPPWPTIVMLLG